MLSGLVLPDEPTTIGDLDLVLSISSRACISSRNRSSIASLSFRPLGGDGESRRGVGGGRTLLDKFHPAWYSSMPIESVSATDVVGESERMVMVGGDTGSNGPPLSSVIASRGGSAVPAEEAVSMSVTRGRSTPAPRGVIGRDLSSRLLWSLAR